MVRQLAGRSGVSICGCATCRSRRPVRVPFTPGSDLVGEIVALGEGVSRFVRGDRVISTATPDWTDGLRPGTARTPAYRALRGYYPGVLAEFVGMPEDWLVRAP